MHVTTSFWTPTLQNSFHHIPCVYKQSEDIMLVAEFSISLPKAAFFLTPLRWALCHFYLLNFVFYSSLFPAFFASFISSLISTKQIYSFNFPPETCITSRWIQPAVVLRTRGLGSKVTLINSHPLLGMTNFPGAVTKKYDAPFVPPSGSSDRLANQRAAGLNLPNFLTKQKALLSCKQTQPCCLTGCLLHHRQRLHWSA